MIALSKLVEFLNEYLEIDDIKDTCWNGLQFERKDEVKKIAFAVDASIETFRRTIEEKAEFIYEILYLLQPPNKYIITLHPHIIGRNRMAAGVVG